MKYRCPCCNYKTLVHNDPLYHDICPVCYWESDPIQNIDEEYAGGANEISLKEAKFNYITFNAIEKNFIPFIRPPKPEEM